MLIGSKSPPPETLRWWDITCTKESGRFLKGARKAGRRQPEPHGTRVEAPPIFEAAHHWVGELAEDAVQQTKEKMYPDLVFIGANWDVRDGAPAVVIPEGADPISLELAMRDAAAEHQRSRDFQWAYARVALGFDELMSGLRRLEQAGGRLQQSMRHEFASTWPWSEHMHRMVFPQLDLQSLPVLGELSMNLGATLSIGGRGVQ